MAKPSADDTSDAAPAGLNISGSVLEAHFALCPSCDARLYDVVKHCPFCGVEQPVAEQTGAVDTPPGRMVADAAVAAVAPVAAAPSPAPAAAVNAPPPAAPPVVKPTAPAEPVKAPPAGAPSVSPKPDVAAPPPPKPQRSKAGIVMALALGLAVLAGGSYLIGKPTKKEDACDQALNQAAVLLSSGDAAGAHGQTVLAMASCSGETRVKAGELQAAADKLIAGQAQCERSFRRIGSQIAEHRLQSARGTLDQLDTACAESLQGKGLRSQIETAQAAATAAETEMRKQMADGDLKAARVAFDQISANNREHPDLAALRQELAAGVKAQESTAPMNAPAATAPAGTTPRDIQREVQRESPQAAGPQPTLPAVAAPPTLNPQAEMAQSFLRDAEAAMNQLKFDAAKTYVESARRLDPGNPQAATLARRIKERELQYLKDETSIK